MPQYLDIYFSLNDRSFEKVKEFVHQYAPVYEESAIGYPIPIYSSNPTKIFTNIFDLFNYLEKDNSCEYIVYLRNLDDSSRLKHIIVKFTNDGKIIVGVSVNGNDPSDAEVGVLFHELKRSLKADIGYITVEEQPPSSYSEFLNLSQNRYVPQKV